MLCSSNRKDVFEVSDDKYFSISLYFLSSVPSFPHSAFCFLPHSLPRSSFPLHSFTLCYFISLQTVRYRICIAPLSYYVDWLQRRCIVGLLIPRWHRLHGRLLYDARLGLKIMWRQYST